MARSVHAARLWAVSLQTSRVQHLQRQTSTGHWLCVALKLTHVGLSRDGEGHRTTGPKSPPWFQSEKFKHRASILAAKRCQHLAFKEYLPPYMCFQNRLISWRRTIQFPQNCPSFSAKKSWKPLSLMQTWMACHPVILKTANEWTNFVRLGC